MCAFAWGALALHIRDFRGALHNRALSPPPGAELGCDDDMTLTDAATDRSSLVPGAHRLIRTIDGKEGPFAGSLITYEEGVAVCVSVEQLTQWPGWAFSDAEHVCGVLDIRRRADGQDALLPWCTGRIEAFLGRRQIADAPLTPGELGTLVASVLRGVRELGTEESDVTGDWWLTGDGRPIFVHGEGGTARARTASLVERSAQHTSDRATIRVLDDVAAALRQPRHHVEDERRWEEELFAIAAPRALRLDVFAPERAGEISAQRMTSAPPAPRTRRATRRQGREVTPSDRWRRLVAAVYERVTDVIARLPRLMRVPTGGSTTARSTTERSTTARSTTAHHTKPSRRRALLLAGSLGAAVLIIGLMWPTGGSGDDAEAAARAGEIDPSAQVEKQQVEKQGAETTQDETAKDETAQEPPGASEPAPNPTDSSETESRPEDADVLTALPSVLAALRDCVEEGDTACAGSVTEGARMPTEGVVLRGADASTAVLVEDYGDVAVVRLSPADAADVEQMLVMERQNDRWLLRDVYDVAQQPA